MNISFYDLDRVLDDALADVGADENTRSLAKCDRRYRYALIIELITRARRLAEKPQEMQAQIDALPEAEKAKILACQERIERECEKN